MQCTSFNSLNWSFFFLRSVTGWFVGQQRHFVASPSQDHGCHSCPSHRSPCLWSFSSLLSQPESRLSLARWACCPTRRKAITVTEWHSHDPLWIVTLLLYAIEVHVVCVSPIPRNRRERRRRKNHSPLISFLFNFPTCLRRIAAWDGKPVKLAYCNYSSVFDFFLLFFTRLFTTDETADSFVKKRFPLSLFVQVQKLTKWTLPAVCMWTFYCLLASSFFQPITARIIVESGGNWWTYSVVQQGESHETGKCEGDKNSLGIHFCCSLFPAQHPRYRILSFMCCWWWWWWWLAESKTRQLLHDRQEHRQEHHFPWFKSINHPNPPALFPLSVKIITQRDAFAMKWKIKTNPSSKW